MRVVLDRIEEEIAIVEKSDGSFEHMPKGLIPPEAKEGDILQISVDTESTVDRMEEITVLMDQLWKSDGEER